MPPSSELDLHPGPILVTGAAGFIGSHVAEHLLLAGATVVGLDHLAPPHADRLKPARLARLSKHPLFTFHQRDLTDAAAVQTLFDSERFPYVIHLAAQASVRRSLDAPRTFGESNLMGFLEILEGCQRVGTRHLVYASSSSVYGADTTAPFTETAEATHPLSLYAATKRAGELMAHAYAHLHDLAVTGLRFFTVYGPWGRPDMAYFIFTKALFDDAPITLFNQGRIWRDFTYIDDVVDVVCRLLPRPARSTSPARLINVGHGKPTPIHRVVATLEHTTGCTTTPIRAPLPPGDLVRTEADTTNLDLILGARRFTPLEEGLARFVDWYRDFYGIRDR
ncbi:MAG: NAD-dependent epimerase/dehydratase family protein [Bacteroidota bacterium]